MPGRSRQAQDYLILDKSDNIQFRRCQDTVDRCVRVETSEFTLIPRQQELRTQVQHILHPAKAALAPEIYRALDPYLQARPGVRSGTPSNAILQLTVIICQIITQALEVRNRNFTTEHPCITGKIEGIYNNWG
jgi:hypothetical protein